MQPTDERLRREAQGFVDSADVFLFEVDATEIGGEIYRFTPSPVFDVSGVSVVPSFGGISYAVIPMTSSGWEWSGDGSMPQPLVRFEIARNDGDVTSVAATVLSLVEWLNDLVGATVRRIRTKRRFLDDGETPDPDAHFGVEVYLVEQKVTQTPTLVEFRLTSALDLEGVKLPGRQMLSTCPYRYRSARSDGQFRYFSCPYAGADMFDVHGNPVTAPEDDKCSKRLSGCRARHGAGEALPFAGFPGLNRVGVT